MVASEVVLIRVRVRMVSTRPVAAVTMMSRMRVGALVGGGGGAVRLSVQVDGQPRDVKRQRASGQPAGGGTEARGRTEHVATVTDRCGIVKGRAGLKGWAGVSSGRKAFESKLRVVGGVFRFIPTGMRTADGGNGYRRAFRMEAQKTSARGARRRAKNLRISSTQSTRLATAPMRKKSARGIGTVWKMRFMGAV